MNSASVKTYDEACVYFDVVAANRPEALAIGLADVITERSGGKNKGRFNVNRLLRIIDGIISQAKGNYSISFLVRHHLTETERVEWEDCLGDMTTLKSCPDQAWVDGLAETRKKIVDISTDSKGRTSIQILKNTLLG